MINRQEFEAESLSARQTAELLDKQGRAPMVRVSFPFPEVFEQARQEMLTMLEWLLGAFVIEPHLIDEITEPHMEPHRRASAWAKSRKHAPGTARL